MFHEEPTGAMAGISPKKSFLLGLGAGILVLCSIGFFVLLGVMLKGGGINLAAGGNQPATQVLPSAQDTVGAGTQPAANPDGTEQVAGTVAPVTDSDHLRGDKNAPVTLIEYSDFQCPFCQRFHPVMTQLMNEYKGKVRWVYRHYPLSFHPNAQPAANAAECAAEQGKFWEYADKLIENQGTLGDDLYKKLAGDFKLNVANWQSCYNTKKYDSRVTADQASGNAAGVSGTPGTVIIRKDGSIGLIPGAYPYASVKAMVDAALK